jgi:hypothetical protein
MSKIEHQPKLQGGLSGGQESPSPEMKTAAPPAFSLTAGMPPSSLKAGVPGGEAEGGQLIGGGDGHALLGGGAASKPPASTPTPTPSAAPPPPITVGSRTTTPARWGPNGEFEWVVAFDTSGTNGWIVQEVVNVYNPQDATGKPLGPPHATPKYYEAWAVSGSSVITPNPTGSNDWWLRPDRGSNTKGNWSMTAKVYFTTTDPKTQGFTTGGVPDAGILLSSTTAPSGLGTVKLNRKADGNWDSSATPAIGHKGSAA